MKNYRTIMLTLACMCGTVCFGQKIDLAGEWNVQLGTQKQIHSIQLPGSTDDAALGEASVLTPTLAKPQLTYLTRKHSYTGKAYYRKKIVVPASWGTKQIQLKLERVLWKSGIRLNGQEVKQSCNSLSTPHVYNLTNLLLPGKQLLEIEVDNSKLYEDLLDMTHAYTDHTQIRWNGVLGEISLTAKDPVEITDVRAIPNIDEKSVVVKTYLRNHTAESVQSTLRYKVNGTISEIVSLKPGDTVVQKVYPLGKDVRFWSEFDPHLYTLKVELQSQKWKDEFRVKFGMREFKREGNKLINNHIPVFLRGTLECCIFPLTGYPPMDKASWRKLFGTAKEWGLNHLRFHSWCPPSAAFEAADELGFYLQVELPVWSVKIGADASMTAFLYDEGRRIIREYGNHPSFCMFSLGNELQGDMKVLAEMVTTLKAEDPHRLYTTTSFTFEKGHGDWPELVDDFFITQWTKKGWVRGQGVFNDETPSFDKDYTHSVVDMQVPLITHEIGQYAVYPDIKEIKKYTGVLQPLNFMAIKDDLQKKGLLSKADDYLLSSGKLAALLYKEEIERALKTHGISGFQLLDLHDFPGQGTALVGLLNAFWENKGAISAEEFSSFCAPVVPLLRFPKAVYINNEPLVADVEVCNYSPSELKNKELVCVVSDEAGRVVHRQKKQIASLSIGANANLWHIEMPLSEFSSATKLTLSVTITGTKYKNQWNIWVYPSQQTIDYGKVAYTRHFEEAQRWLAEGKTVLYNPDWRYLEGIEGKFVPVFWSPVHFPKQAGTMGVLCNPQHKALQHFPTDEHTDWQWWDLNTYSTTFVTDSIRGGSPIVEMIDNFANNRRLALIYEGRVGTGRVMIASVDLLTSQNTRPVARQMLYSLLKYMNGADFVPAEMENFEVFKQSVTSDKRPDKRSATSIY